MAKAQADAKVKTETIKHQQELKAKEIQLKMAHDAELRRQQALLLHERLK